MSIPFCKFINFSERIKDSTFEYFYNTFIFIKLDLFFWNIRNNLEKQAGKRLNILSPSLTSAIKDDIATAVETVAAVTFPGAVEAFQLAKAFP